MKEHIYKAKKNRIISQSIFIWLFVVFQIGATIFGLSLGLTLNRGLVIIFTNVFLSMITVPAVYLFLKYYKHSVGKKFVITYNSLKYINEKTGEETEIKNTDVEKIYLIETPKNSKLPWLNHEYFSFIDAKRNEIIITSYFMNLGDFWLDSLTRKVSSDKLIRVEKAYPII